MRVLVLVDQQDALDAPALHGPARQYTVGVPLNGPAAHWAFARRRYIQTDAGGSPSGLRARPPGRRGSPSWPYANSTSRHADSQTQNPDLRSPSLSYLASLPTVRQVDVRGGRLASRRCAAGGCAPAAQMTRAHRARACRGWRGAMQQDGAGEHMRAKRAAIVASFSGRSSFCPILYASRGYTLTALVCIGN